MDDLGRVIALHQNLENVLDNLSEGILAHDKNRKITYFNRAAERITGHSRSEVVGQDCHKVFPDGFCGTGLCHFTTLGTELAGRLEETIVFVTKGGDRRRLELSVVPMTDAEGHFVGVLNCFRDVTEVNWLRRRLEDAQSFNGIIGRDHHMQLVFDLINDLADSDAPILIQGESGTGKELVAGAIHGESRRQGRPFVPVNCGAIPEGTLESELFGHEKGAFTGAIRAKKGRFELADGGTIFLDEVAELTPTTQVKLLRVLQNGVFERVGGEEQVKVDVRVISATNKDLRQLVAQNRFREDLFYRLCVVPIQLPPLRERRNDIPLLTEHFLRIACERQNRPTPTVSPQALSALMDYRWPGNVRELQNAIQYALVKSRGNTIEVGHLPIELTGQPDRKPVGVLRRPRKLTSESVRDALSKCGGNKVRAARLLGVGRATLYRFLTQTKPEASHLTK